MLAYAKFILFLSAVVVSGGSGFAADGETGAGDGRFTQAAERTFAAFDPKVEQTWQGDFFFMQLAYPQYGFFNENKSFEKEVALVEQTVQHINRLHPRFVIVCGDLTKPSVSRAARRAGTVLQYSAAAENSAA